MQHAKNVRIQYSGKVRRLVLAVAALLVFLMAGSSWAYWTQEVRVTNEYRLATYSTELVERFTAPDDWKPGSTVEKNVEIKNSGSVPVYLKVVLNQKWVRTENVLDSAGNVVPPAKGGTFPLIFEDDKGVKEFAAQIKWGSDVVLLSSGKTSVSSLSLGLSTVSAAQDAKGKWVLVSETPDANGEYTLYYVGTLEGGKTSPLVIDSVQMNGKIRPSIVEEKTVWDKQKKQWVTTTTSNAGYSYENARYTLGVTMHTVQATKDALNGTFKASGTAEQSLITQLGTYAPNPQDINSSYANTASSHRLYFEETDGRMSFTPVRSGNENWFMSDLNMLPGAAYEHTLLIENRSKKNFDLYMQAMPLQQNTQQNELLEYISMKVYLGTTLVYDGKASGRSYSGSVNDLQNAVLLGNFKPSAQNKIRAEILLDANTPMEYAGLLSKMDWNFMVEEIPEASASPTSTATPEVPYGGVTTPSVPYGPASPKSGDDGVSSLWYIVIMSLSGLCLTGCVAFLIATGKKRERVVYDGF